MKKLIIPGGLIAVGLLVWGLASWGRDAKIGYRFVEVTRGDVQSVVSSTGRLQAITTVEVGTQVSGKIEEIFVDFNDRVTKGQLVARIDPLLLEQAVRSAEAEVARREAELALAQRDFERIERLYEREVTTESEYTTAQYKVAVAQASLKSAQVSLERARQNLGYTEIRSPIDGVVLDRTVDAGQTVAASFSAPQLFLIAEDLSEMEILASVDESDIGKIHEDQAIQFTVQAYPEETFTGTVGQVRLQSTSQENIVNYTVAIAVGNPDGRLLPGMTATVDFIVAQASDVLRVANAALRFRPTEDMVAAHRKQRKELRAQRDSAEELPSRPARPGSGGPAGSRLLLWYLDETGQVTASPVRTGISDDQYTEIAGRDLTEGMLVIAAVTTVSASATVNPFQRQQQTRRRHGPPPGM